MKALSRFLLFASTTLIILLLYAFPFQKMGINAHFFEILNQVGADHSWSSFWTTESVQSHYPFHTIMGDASKSYFYRPVLQSLHGLELYLFGHWWLGYVFTSLLFFALTAGTVAVIFSYFYSFFNVFILTALYVVHPILSPSFYSITALFSAAYFFAALSFLSFIWYFQKRGFIFYLLSLFLYGISIFTYEFLLVAPFLSIIFWLLFHHIKWYEILPYFCFSGLWVGVRFFIIGKSYPYELSLLSYIKMVCFNIMHRLKPFWGIQHSSILVAFVLSILFCFWVGYHYLSERKDRQFILWLLLSSVVATGGLISNSSSTHFCLILPFFVLLLHLLVYHAVAYKYATCFLLIFILLNGFRTFEDFANREQFTNARDIALHELLIQHPLKQYIFLMIPHRCKYETFLFSPSIAQALRFLSQNNDLMIYNFTDISLCTSSFPSDGAIETYTVDGGYRLQVTDPYRIWFSVPHNVEKIESSLGTIFINHRISSDRVTDISIFLKSEYCKKKFLDKTVVLSWDPSIWKFVSVEKEHLIKE